MQLSKSRFAEEHVIPAANFRSHEFVSNETAQADLVTLNKIQEQIQAEAKP